MVNVKKICRLMVSDFLSVVVIIGLIGVFWVGLLLYKCLINLEDCDFN